VAVTTIGGQARIKAFRTRATRLTGRARMDIDKARAMYEWVLKNTEHNPEARGCRVHAIKAMQESTALNVKCADLNALFVGLVRAAGGAGARHLRNPGPSTPRTVA